MIRHSARTHPGHRRPSNEDALLAWPEAGVFVVADGVGGRAAGEVASRLAVDTFQEHGEDLRAAVAAYAHQSDWDSRNAVLELLDEVCQRASARIYEEAELLGHRGMTTTLVAAAVGGGAAFLAHVGDSRAYLIRDGLIRQLTDDHSMVNDLVRTGQMTFDEARKSRYRSVITRALGLHPQVQPDLMSIEILPGDRLVLASDGLSDPLPVEVIEELSGQDDVHVASANLIQAALDRGGPDNVTVVMVEPEATPQTERARARAQVMQELFLFRDLPFHARLRVSRICRDLDFGPGDVLVREETAGSAMYVIVDGEVSVRRQRVELARLGRGEHFGELGLLGDSTRSATVSGLAGGSALVIERRDLVEFCQRDPVLGNELLWRLMRTLGARLSASNELAARRGEPG
jgi:serine/threonine protein phosphatase PrpC